MAKLLNKYENYFRFSKSIVQNLIHLCYFKNQWCNNLGVFHSWIRSIPGDVFKSVVSKLPIVKLV